ncbi:MAG: ABC transporter permease [Eubacteriales bacterium]|nr:ABC transporter permease [Eubacteriales bacterium]MDD4323516.1 ABC transporter permease [Eubacteriales bacterium]
MLLTVLASIVLSVLIINFAKDDPGTDTEKLPVLSVAASIVDEDNSPLGQMLISYLEDISYVEAIYNDDMEQALERLEADDIVVILRLPPGLFEETRSGSQREAVELWLNPRKPAESNQISILVQQYATVLDYLYGSVFGYQKVYVELGGEESASWEESSRHSLNALIMYFGRDRYAQVGEHRPFNVLIHTYAGILMVLSLLPAMGVLAATGRMAGTSYEDRLILSCGSASMMAARLISGFIWWLILLLPPLLALALAGLIGSVFSIAIILMAAYFTLALIMLALGRVKAPYITTMLTGWLTFLIVIVLGGVIYPTSLFPDWLDKSAVFTPIYPLMQFLYRSLYQEGTVGSASLINALWPLVPAGFVAVLFGRRRV